MTNFPLSRLLPCLHPHPLLPSTLLIVHNNTFKPAIQFNQKFHFGNNLHAKYNGQIDANLRVIRSSGQNNVRLRAIKNTVRLKDCVEHCHLF